MNDEVTVEYKGITLTYSEANNRWEFVLRGRERWSDSLKLAKEAIDKPVPEDKKPFTRIKCYRLGRHTDEELEIVEVTSIAAARWGGAATEGWITIGGTHRAKEYLTNLYPMTERNAKLIHQIKVLNGKIEDLQKSRNGFKNKLKALEVSEEVE